MVKICAVFGCNNAARGEAKKLSYYRFPFTRCISSDIIKLTELRRKSWYQFLRRKDIKFENITASLDIRICSEHFVTGKPAKVGNDTHVDWIPTLKGPGAKKANTNRVVQRYRRWKNRNENLVENSVENSVAEFHGDGSDSNSSNVDSTTSMLITSEVQAEIPIQVEVQAEIPIQVQLQNAEQEKLKQSKLIATLRKQNELLKLERNELLLKEQAFINQDEKLNFYTGLPNLEMFHVVMGTIQESLFNLQARNLDNFQKLLLTLMKLRLNVSFTDISYRLQIPKKTVSRVFQRVIIMLKHSLQNLIHWPDRECLKLSTPRCFRARFGTSVTAIIDCFEITTQRPSTMKARNQSWSDYKQKHTAKYLIGITPYGAISFISDGYAGHTTDSFITEDCGILDNLIPGDLILADRGFRVKELVAMKQAILKTPAFKNGKTQLHPREIEESREIAAVRVHVERVIGCVRQKYQLLNGPVPITLLKNSFQNTSLLDCAVQVACILTNLSESVVTDV